MSEKWKGILKKCGTLKILPIIFVPYVPGVGNSGEKSAILQKNTKQSSEKRVNCEAKTQISGLAL